MLADNSLIHDIKTIIAQSREQAVRAVNHERTVMYWHIGQRIFEEEQRGKERADYGAYLVQSRNSAAAFPSGRLSAVVSFIAHFQLRPHCGRN